MDWTRGPTIGRGSSATVSIVRAHQSGDVFAVKTAEFSQSEFLEREQRILSSIVCPQIIGYKGYSVTTENGKLLYNIFMEYASDGTLVDAIREHGGRLEEAMIRSYTRKVLQGLDYLHSNGIVHCDIKGRNILVADDGVKIADFGCAKWVDGDSVSGSAPPVIGGTPLFMAPEVARGQEQGYPADLWALGCTVIEMATGRTPWNDVSDPVSALYRIGFSGELPEIPSFLSEEGKDFLDKCLKRNPRERWSASELLKHSFVEEPQFVLKGIDEHDLDSPISVLDHVFWNWMEVVETTDNSTRRTNSSSPPAQRIRQLCGAMSTLSTSVPNWTWDEDWVTVRSKNMNPQAEQEVSICFWQDEKLCGNEPTSSGLDMDTDIDSARQDYNLLYHHETTSSSEIGSWDESNRSSGSCYNGCDSRGNSTSNNKNCLLLACCNMEDVSCNCILHKHKKVFCFLASNFISLEKKPYKPTPSISSLSNGLAWGSLFFFLLQENNQSNHRMTFNIVRNNFK